MRFSVVIPTVRATGLGDAVASIRSQTFADWELLVVGQGPGEAQLRSAVARVASGDTRVRYLHLERMGLCVARNAGLAASKGEIVAFTDDDCEAAPNWLAELDQCFAPGTGFVCGAVKAPPRARRLLAMCPTVAPADVTYEPALSGLTLPPGFRLLGANMAVRRDIAERVGAFDECLGSGSAFGGGDEHDYMSRLAQLGVRMRSTPNAVVTHSYGYRYGWRSVYAVKRARIRGDGGLAGKRTLVDAAGPVSVAGSVWGQARRQFPTLSPIRLPNNAFRLFHYLSSYRECLRNYRVAGGADSPSAVLVLSPRPRPGRVRPGWPFHSRPSRTAGEV